MFCRGAAVFSLSLSLKRKHTHIYISFLDARTHSLSLALKRINLVISGLNVVITRSSTVSPELTLLIFSRPFKRETKMTGNFNGALNKVVLDR